MSRPRILTRRHRAVEVSFETAAPGPPSPPTPPHFNWGDAVADATIIGGMSVISALAGLSAASIRADPGQAAIALIVSFFGPFLGTLALRRGLKR